MLPKPLKKKESVMLQSYQDRVSAVESLIDEHNKMISADMASVSAVDVYGHVRFAMFVSQVRMMGGTSVERLADLSHEDISECLVNAMGSVPANVSVPTPRILAKAIAAIFRGGGDKDGKSESSGEYVSVKRAEKMSVAELLAALDPADVSTAVAKRLRVLSKGDKFIVFSSGRVVDIATSAKLLLEIRSGYPGRSEIRVNDRPVKVYALGELPDSFAEENPLYPGRPLRPDGTCDQLNRSWEGVAMEVRQLIRVAIDVGELRVSHETAHTIMDIALSADAMNKLRERYSRASVSFDGLAALGDMPKLRVKLAQGGVSPFAGGRKVQVDRHVRVSPPAVIPDVQFGVWCPVWYKRTSTGWTTNYGIKE
jgi:hypothetical protein